MSDDSDKSQSEPIIVDEALDAVILDKINNSVYWYECQECDFKTDDYIKQYHHKAQSEHIVKVKDVTIEHIGKLLR